MNLLQRSHDWPPSAQSSVTLHASSDVNQAIGALNAGGALRENQAFCAHPKFDADSGRMIAFSLGLRFAEGGRHRLLLWRSSSRLLLGALLVPGDSRNPRGAGHWFMQHHSAIAGKLHIMELNPDGNVHQKITLPGVFNPITYVHDFMVTKSWCVSGSTLVHLSNWMCNATLVARTVNMLGFHSVN